MDEYEGQRPESLDYFLKLLDLTEDEFMKIVLQHQISPWKYDDSKISRGKRLPDQEEWEDTPLL